MMIDQKFVSGCWYGNDELDCRAARKDEHRPNFNPYHSLIFED